MFCWVRTSILRGGTVTTLLWWSILVRWVLASDWLKQNNTDLWLVGRVHSWWMFTCTDPTQTLNTLLMLSELSGQDCRYSPLIGWHNSILISDWLTLYTTDLWLVQVLMGDLKPAIEQHEVLYQIMQRHNFLPEAVTADFQVFLICQIFLSEINIYQVHWGQHLLRPEFVESTYFLYKATRDPYYLEAGKKVLQVILPSDWLFKHNNNLWLVVQALQQHARVTCGYAAVKDVRTLQVNTWFWLVNQNYSNLWLVDSMKTGWTASWSVKHLSISTCSSLQRMSPS